MFARPAVKNEGQKIAIAFKVLGDAPGEAGSDESEFCSGLLVIMVILVVT